MNILDNLSLKSISDFIGGNLVGDDKIINKITTDSRITDGQVLFVGIKGDRFDGNDFAKSFLENGGTCAVSEKDFEVPNGKAAIFVDDTKKALRDIAEYYRVKLGLDVIGVTGSVGKTSTKDMLNSVIGCGFKTFATKGNFNNEIGVPLTVFELDSTVEKAIIEMGMSSLGEISVLTKIAKPKIAVITNIGTAHIGNLGSRENILKAKLEILEGLQPNGTLITNADDDMLVTVKDKLNCKIVYVAIEKADADYVAYDILTDANGSSFKVKIKNKEYEFKINVVGKHHIYNALSAIACGIELGMEVKDIIKGVSNFAPSGMRQKEIKVGRVTLVEDCYNASTSSMDSSLCMLSAMANKRRTIAVLGDILEQGNFAEENHRKVGEYAINHKINTLVTVGNDAKYIADEVRKNGNNNVYEFENNNSAAEFLGNYILDDDVVLFKASRGMKFEEISSKLQELLKGRN